MKTVLILTVGGSHQPLVRAIEHWRPDFVCFVCSTDDPATNNKGSYTQITGKGLLIKANFRDDKPTLPNIPAQTGLSAEQFEVLQVMPDDFDDVYGKTTAWMNGRDLSRERVVADYTGGTKTMSAALAVAALDTDGVRLHLVTGSRADLVKVTSGGEQVMPASVEGSRFRRRLEQAVSAWSRYAYDESVAMLQAIPVPADANLRGEYQRALDLSRAFAAWDRFDHRQAGKITNQYRAILGGNGFGSLLISMDRLLEDDASQQPAMIYDLWRNAQRRASQHRFDDAVARTYRLFEWSAQWLLHASSGLTTADIPEDRIPEGITLTRNRAGRYQAGLFNAWALAAHWGDEDVKQFWQEQKEAMTGLIQARNHSILAHGFTPLGEDDWQDMACWTEQNLLPLLLRKTARPPWRIQELPVQFPDRYRKLA